MTSVISKLLEQARIRGQIKSNFEHLKDAFEKTSDIDGRYNCIAHAAEEHHRKWWPVPLAQARNDTYWPEGIAREETVSAFVQAFIVDRRYEPCDELDLSIEEGYQKVALFVATRNTLTTCKGNPTHMARQLPCGKWTSKLGGNWDIQHETAEGLQGRKYGELHTVLKRRRQFRIVKEQTG